MTPEPGLGSSSCQSGGPRPAESPPFISVCLMCPPIPITQTAFPHLVQLMPRLASYLLTSPQNLVEDKAQRSRD